MIPVVGLLLSGYVPDAFFSALLAAFPLRVHSGYQALLLATALVYLPVSPRRADKKIELGGQFGLNLLYKLKLTGGKVDNVNPRKQAETLKATHPAFARLAVRSPALMAGTGWLQAAEQNMQEGMLIFAPAVLAATQAGVSKVLICQFGTAWLLARAAYVFVYAIGSNEALGALRSLLFVISLLATGKLLHAAAALA